MPCRTPTVTELINPLPSLSQTRSGCNETTEVESASEKWSPGLFNALTGYRQDAGHGHDHP
jgi:hypothetical protein